MITILVHQSEHEIQQFEKAEEIIPLLKEKDALVWIDLENPTSEESQLLSDIFHFHPLAIEDCYNDTHHPKVDDYGDYLFLVFHGTVALDLEAEPIRTEELDVFLGKNYLVTFHFTPKRSIQKTHELCLQRASLMARGSDFLLHTILDTLIDHYEPIIEQLDDLIDRLEDEALTRPSERMLARLFVLKKSVIYLRRVILPQREVITRLARGEFPLISPQCTVFFRDISDHLYRIHDLSESYREVMSGIMEVYLSGISNRLNEIMKVLTIIATIIMPMTLITGVYGMNFEYFPELHWKYGYFAVLGVMGSIALGMLSFFRRKGWF